MTLYKENASGYASCLASAWQKIKNKKKNQEFASQLYIDLLPRVITWLISAFPAMSSDLFKVQLAFSVTNQKAFASIGISCRWKILFNETGPSCSLRFWSAAIFFFFFNFSQMCLLASHHTDTSSTFAPWVGLLMTRPSLITFSMYETVLRADGFAGNLVTFRKLFLYALSMRDKCQMMSVCTRRNSLWSGACYWSCLGKTPRAVC